eukprot:4147585-Amphidinium_carterae.1
MFQVLLYACCHGRLSASSHWRGVFGIIPGQVFQPFSCHLRSPTVWRPDADDQICSLEGANARGTTTTGYVMCLQRGENVESA